MGNTTVRCPIPFDVSHRNPMKMTFLWTTLKISLVEHQQTRSLQTKNQIKTFLVVTTVLCGNVLIRKGKKKLGAADLKLSKKEPLLFFRKARVDHGLSETPAKKDERHLVACRRNHVTLYYLFSGLMSLIKKKSRLSVRES